MKTIKGQDISIDWTPRRRNPIEKGEGGDTFEVGNFVCHVKNELRYIQPSYINLLMKSDKRAFSYLMDSIRTMYISELEKLGYTVSDANQDEEE